MYNMKNNLLIFLSIIFLSIFSLGKTITYTDWRDFKKYTKSQNINKAQYKLEEKQIELRISGQITNIDKTETIEIDNKKMLMIPLLKVTQYQVSDKALPSKTDKFSSFLGLLKLDSNEHPFYIVYNPKTKNFGILAGETPKNETDKKMLKNFKNALDKQIFFTSIRYLYK